MVMGGGWVIDLDIQGFFDVLDHSHLRGFLGYIRVSQLTNCADEAVS